MRITEKRLKKNLEKTESTGLNKSVTKKREKYKGKNCLRTEKKTETNLQIGKQKENIMKEKPRIKENTK